jgi:hypothetical protein
MLVKRLRRHILRISRSPLVFLIANDAVASALNEVDVRFPVRVSIAGLRVRRNFRDRDIRERVLEAILKSIRFATLTPPSIVFHFCSLACIIIRDFFLLSMIC